jgi:hypothetical protein
MDRKPAYAMFHCPLSAMGLLYPIYYLSCGSGEYVVDVIAKVRREEKKYAKKHRSVPTASCQSK